MENQIVDQSMQHMPGYPPSADQSPTLARWQQELLEDLYLPYLEIALEDVGPRSVAPHLPERVVKALRIRAETRNTQLQALKG